MFITLEYAVWVYYLVMLIITMNIKYIVEFTSGNYYTEYYHCVHDHKYI